MRVGDFLAKILSKQPLQGPLGVRVVGVSRDRVDVELYGEPPANDSPFDAEFRVFHTSDGVTGRLEPFVGTDAMQLVDIFPNELMPLGLFVKIVTLFGRFTGGVVTRQQRILINCNVSVVIAKEMARLNAGNAMVRDT